MLALRGSGGVGWLMLEVLVHGSERNMSKVECRQSKRCVP